LFPKTIRNDSADHKQIREQIMEPIDTEDDKTFSREEIASAINRFNPKKAPGEDGLRSEILLRAFRSFPSFLTEVYNKCLKEGCFSKQWKKSSNRGKKIVGTLRNTGPSA
jgi:hypothetical protein